MSEDGVRRRGMTRQAIVARALEIGDAEGLEAVSLRRVASDLGVTPMALYRHVKDKQDLLNAMTEVVLDGIDVTAGFEPSMTWVEKVRLALMNFREQMETRSLALPLSIAYSGDGPVSFWRMSEALLDMLLGAGFERREAVVLIRIVSMLVSGYLLLRRQSGTAIPEQLDERTRDLVRRRMELVSLSLPSEQFPNIVASAGELADVWISDPDQWWQDTVDLLVFGLERLLERSRARTSA